MDYDEDLDLADQFTAWNFSLSLQKFKIFGNGRSLEDKSKMDWHGIGKLTNFKLQQEPVCPTYEFSPNKMYRRSKWFSGCSSVGRTVDSDTRDP